MTPQPEDTMQATNEETVVSVPDYLDPNRGVIKKAVESISDAFTSTPDPNPPPVTSTTDQN
jgi:outer membrane protein assembly factor BamE